MQQVCVKFSGLRKSRSIIKNFLGEFPNIFRYKKSTLLLSAGIEILKVIRNKVGHCINVFILILSKLIKLTNDLLIRRGSKKKSHTSIHL